MFLTQSTINDKTITLLSSRIISNNVRIQKYGELILSEFNIDEISALSSDDMSYYPKRILTDLIPFLVEIINSDTISKAVYSFSVALQRRFENPNDVQYLRKEIEVEIISVEDRNNIENIVSNCIDYMGDPRKFFNPSYYDSDSDSENEVEVEVEKRIILTVTRVQLLEEIRREKINNIRSYKDDACVICTEAKPDILFCDCGHVCICEECFIVLDGNKCPKCRVKNKVIRKI